MDVVYGWQGPGEQGSDRQDWMEQVNSAGRKHVHWAEAEELVKKRWDMFSYLFMIR